MELCDTVNDILLEAFTPEVKAAILRVSDHIEKDACPWCIYLRAPLFAAKQHPFFQEIVSGTPSSR